MRICISADDMTRAVAPKLYCISMTLLPENRLKCDPIRALVDLNPYTTYLHNCYDMFARLVVPYAGTSAKVVS